MPFVRLGAKRGENGRDSQQWVGNGKHHWRNGMQIRRRASRAWR